MLSPLQMEYLLMAGRIPLETTASPGLFGGS